MFNSLIKKIGAFAVTGLAGLLLVYSATRSLDFIGLTLPPDRQILAWFGLAALDGGIVVWLLAFMFGSRGWQRAIAILMVLADLVGAVAMFTADALYNTGKTGLTVTFTQNEMQTFVMVLSGVIALNIAAAVAHHIAEPEQMRRAAEEDAFDRVEEETLKQITGSAEKLAAELAPMRAASWVDRTRALYLAPDVIDGRALPSPSSAEQIPGDNPQGGGMPLPLFGWMQKRRRYQSQVEPLPVLRQTVGNPKGKS
jgi:hypothetical protein